MRLSTKGRYGMRAMLELGLRYGTGPTQASAISDSQEVSLKYLHLILNELRNSGLVRSVRGALGGYELTRHPSEINLWEILRATEGPLTLVDCVEDGRSCARQRTCASHEVWKEMSEVIEDLLTARTVADLVARQLELDEE